MMLIRPWGRFLAVSIFIFAFDRLTKLIAFKVLALDRSLPVIPGIFHFTLVLNTGAAFGMLKDRRLFFVATSIIAVAFMVFYLWRHKTAGSTLLFAFGLITGGAAGNLFDRIKYGHVIDFLDFRIWPVFNIADSAITIGAVLLVWLVLTKNQQLRANN